MSEPTLARAYTLLRTKAGRALLNNELAIAPGQRAALRRGILAIEDEARAEIDVELSDALRAVLKAWGLTPEHFLESLHSWGYEIRVAAGSGDE